jgi:hypothetical protein
LLVWFGQGWQCAYAEWEKWSLCQQQCSADVQLMEATGMAAGQQYQVWHSVNIQCTFSEHSVNIQ